MLIRLNLVKGVRCCDGDNVLTGAYCLCRGDNKTYYLQEYNSGRKPYLIYTDKSYLPSTVLAVNASLREDGKIPNTLFSSKYLYI